MSPRICLSLLVVLCSCATEQPGLSPMAFMPKLPARASAPAADAFDGVILSKDSRLVTAEVDGRIDNVIAVDGQRVEAGGAIAELDQQDLAKQVEAARGAEEQAIGQLETAESGLAEAARVYRQQKGLYDDKAVSRDSVQSARSQFSVAGAQVRTAVGAVKHAKAAREQAEQIAGKVRIVSPIAGVLTQVKITKGGMAARGQPVARVSDPSDLWVRYVVPPEKLGTLKVDDQVLVTPMHGGTPLVATVKVINRTQAPPLRFAVIEADLDDSALPDHDTLLGESAKVSLKR